MDATTYVSSVKAHVSAATAAATICGNTTSNVATYSTRPQFTFVGTGLCASPRQVVTATVSAAPTITAQASTPVICGNGSTNLSVTSENANYTYVWTPGNLTGAQQTVNPTATTTYT
ncbi:hypothetical protein, partial [Klebsiella pneumoniae]|uniref:hypothetical protein n=1 Tax=Klebsiella pneumoniae TaxID=573 RepID=UPI001E657E21